MFKWKRMPWLAALALGTVLALAGGCSDDDDDDEDDEFDLRAGTWSLTGTTSESGGAGCTDETGPETEVVEVCDPAEDLFEGFDCDVETDGDEFSFHCTITQTIEECTFTLHLQSEGTFTDTTYTATSTLFATVSPTTPPCNEFVNPCTTTVHETGTWLDAGDCATKPGVPLRALVRRAGSLAGRN